MFIGTIEGLWRERILTEHRATIGRLFSSNVKNGWGIYRRVEAIKKPDGEPKRSVNRAQMYRITK